MRLIQVIISALTLIKEISQIRSDIDNECRNLIYVFGDAFKYEDTDFPSLQHIMKVRSEIKTASSLIATMQEISQGLDPEDNEKNRKFGSLYRGLETTWEDIFNVIQWCASSKEDLQNDKYKLTQYYENGSGNVSEETVFEALCNLEQIDNVR